MVSFVPTLDSPALHKIIRSQGSRLVFKYPNTIKSLLSNNKSPDLFCNSCVYKTSCKDCNEVYFGETGRDINVRVKEHKADFFKCKCSNALFSHSSDSGHSIDFNSIRIIYKYNNLKRHRIVESVLIQPHSDHVLNQNRGFYECNSFTLFFSYFNTFENGS